MNTVALKIRQSMFGAPNPGSRERREREDRKRTREDEERGGVFKRVMGGDTVFFALHLLWAHWSRVYWGRGREVELEPGDRLWSWNWGIGPKMEDMFNVSTGARSCTVYSQGCKWARSSVLDAGGKVTDVQQAGFPAAD